MSFSVQGLVFLHPPFIASGPWVRMGCLQLAFVGVPSLGEDGEEALPLWTAPAVVFRQGCGAKARRKVSLLCTYSSSRRQWAGAGKVWPLCTAL